ncbi:MAG: ABC transporter ATP-binding protein [archaeon]|nr:ABC transporter ATP-binding protein [archaeon]
MLEVKDLHVEAGGKEILKGVSFTVMKGETCVLFGPNGSGKSTLLSAIMGLTTCKVTHGEIIFNGKNITGMAVNERAKMGIGMMMQRPPNVTGVTLGDLCKAISSEDHLILKKSSEFKMKSFLERDINVGFSGGEIKRSELMQLMAQKPDFILLDEPESGVDLENISLIGRKVHELLYSKEDSKCKDRTELEYKHVSSLIITHTGQILDYTDADRAFVLMDGLIRCTGRPMDIFKDIREKGYEGCVSCRMVQTSQ